MLAADSTITQVHSGLNAVYMLAWYPNHGTLPLLAPSFPQENALRVLTSNLQVYFKNRACLGVGNFLQLEGRECQRAGNMIKTPKCYKDNLRNWIFSFSVIIIIYINHSLGNGEMYNSELFIFFTFASSRSLKGIKPSPSSLSAWFL